MVTWSHRDESDERQRDIQCGEGNKYTHEYNKEHVANEDDPISMTAPELSILTMTSLVGLGDIIAAVNTPNH